MQNILVTGADGQLGHALRKLVKRYADFSFVFTDVDDLDITNAPLIQRFFELNTVDFCINAAAYTAVDKAESEMDTAFLINADAVEILAKVCAASKTKLVHISTDFVFDGEQSKPYVEADTTNPLSVYGQSKLQGEEEARRHCEKHFVVRTSWLYGRHGKNFLNTMLRLGTERETVSVVNDQVGTPTSAADLAECLMQIVSEPDAEAKYGTYHFANEGACSWYEFATAIMELAGLNCEVHPIGTEAYPTAAKRPSYSVLDKSKVKEAFGLKIPDWRESLTRVLNQQIAK